MSENGVYPDDLDRINELNQLALKLNRMSDAELTKAETVGWLRGRQFSKHMGRSEAFSDAVDQVHKLAFKWLAEAKEYRGL